MKNIYFILIWILLVIPPLLFFTDLTRNPYYFQIFLLNEIILIFWILFFLDTVKRKKIKWYITPFDLPLLCFVFIALISILKTYFFTPDYHLPEIIDTGKKLINENFLSASIISEGTKKIIFTLVNVLMAYWISLNFITEKEIKKVYHILFIVGFIAGSYAILQYFGIEPIWPKVLNPFSGRPVSTFGNPNFMSSYLVLLFPVILAYMLTTTKFAEKIFYLILILTYYIALLCTLTRSSWIGLFTAVSIIFLFLYFQARKNNNFFKVFLNREKKWIFLFIIAVIAGFIFLPKNKFGSPSTIERITEIKTTAKTVYAPVHQRLLIWSSAWDMFKENPILGQGWGLFELYYPFYQGKYLFNPTYRTLRTHANNAHNEIIEIASQTGIVGLTLYLWFLITLIVYTVKLTINIDAEKKIFITAITAGIAGMFVDNIFGNVSLHFCVPAFLYWWNIGTIACFDTGKRSVEIEVNRKIKIIITWIIFFLLFLFYRNYKLLMGEINYFKGFKYSKRNEVVNAIKYLEKSHKYYREVNSEYELANSYARIGKKEEAIWAYYQALSANCGYDEIHFNLASVFSQKGDTKNAYLNFSQALFINPTSKESYLSLGNVLFSDLEKNKYKAIEVFKQASFFYPENPDIWNNLGYLYMIAGENENAIKAYKKSIEINPEFEHARNNLKNLLKQLGRNDEINNEYDNLIREIEKKIQHQEWKQVMELSKKLIQIAPGSFKARFYLANALLTQNMVDESINEYHNALKIDSRNIYAMVNLGIAYLQKNDLTSAREIFKRVLEIDPSNKVAKEKLELISNLLKK